MHNCMANIFGRLAKNGIPWSDLFTALVESRPKVLRQMVIKGHDMYEDMTEEAWKGETEGTGRGPFQYAMLDDKHGMCSDDEVSSDKRFESGEDERAWNELMNIVKKNQLG